MICSGHFPYERPQGVAPVKHSQQIRFETIAFAEDEWKLIIGRKDPLNSDKLGGQVDQISRISTILGDAFRSFSCISYRLLDADDALCHQWNKPQAWSQSINRVILPALEFESQTSRTKRFKTLSRTRSRKTRSVRQYLCFNWTCKGNVSAFIPFTIVSETAPWRNAYWPSCLSAWSLRCAIWYAVRYAIWYSVRYHVSRTRCSVSKEWGSSVYLSAISLLTRAVFLGDSLIDV